MYWVVRESVRKALNNKKIEFNNMEEIIESAKSISKVKYNFDITQIIKRSRLLEQIKMQRRLQEWF